MGKEQKRNTNTPSGLVCLCVFLCLFHTFYSGDSKSGAGNGHVYLYITSETLVYFSLCSCRQRGSTQIRTPPGLGPVRRPPASRAGVGEGTAGDVSGGRDQERHQRFLRHCCGKTILPLVEDCRRGGQGRALGHGRIIFHGALSRVCIGDMKDYRAVIQSCCFSLSFSREQTYSSTPHSECEVYLSNSISCSFTQRSGTCVLVGGLKRSQTSVSTPPARVYVI